MKIIKRNGTEVQFDELKITAAIEKANKEVVETERLSEEDIDNIILGKNTGYMQELKERVREVTIGYVTELLGTFRELGIDFRTTQTVFMGGGAILVSEIIKVVWERFKGEYFIINDPKANAKGYKLQFQIEAKERED